MKILVGMPSKDSWGGPIASEPPFVDALRQLGHDVMTEVYVYGDKETPTPFLKRIRRVLKTVFRFRKVLRENEFDIIHLNTAFDLRTILRDSVSVFLMKPGNAKVFFKLHGSAAEAFSNAPFITKRLIKYLQTHVDGFGYHTQEELTAFIALGFGKSKFFPVRNAVTIQESLPSGFSRQQKDPNEIFEILFVSRFIPAKGLVETIEACEELRKSGIKFRLTCIGDGPSRRDADDTVGRLGLGRVVTFTGHVSEDEVTRYFLNSDIFIFPTQHIEGFPNVLFKAVSVGLPVVTTRIRAAKDYLSEPENCLFCTNEPSHIAGRTVELISDVGLRESMSRNNIAYGKTLLPETIANEFVEIYEAIIK